MAIEGPVDCKVVCFLYFLLFSEFDIVRKILSIEKIILIEKVLLIGENAKSAHICQNAHILVPKNDTSGAQTKILRPLL